MNAPLTHRTVWVDHRVSVLVADHVDELVEAVQEHGGGAHIALCDGLHDAFYAGDHEVAAAGRDTTIRILQAFAFARATKEYDSGARPS